MLYLYVKYKIIKDVESVYKKRNININSLNDRAKSNDLKSLEILNKAQDIEKDYVIRSEKLESDIISEFSKSQYEKIMQIKAETLKTQEACKKTMEEQLLKFCKSSDSYIKELSDIVVAKITNEVNVNKLPK